MLALVFFGFVRVIFSMYKLSFLQKMELKRQKMEIWRKIECTDHCEFFVRMFLTRILGP